MYKLKNLIVFAPACLLAVVALSGCNENKDVRVLHVLNSEDYIYEAERNDWYCDECEDYISDHKVVEVEGEKIDIHTVRHELEEDSEAGDWYCVECDEHLTEEDLITDGDKKYHEIDHEVYFDMSMIDQFSDYWFDLTGEEVKVIYDTFDTNETMFNQLNTGKSTYDVICTSDYMIQKLIANRPNKMLHEFKDYEHTTKDGIWENISSELVNRCLNIKATQFGHEEAESVYDYSVPYMWGTIGVMYNPSFYISKFPTYFEEVLGEDLTDENYDDAVDVVIDDFKSWDNFYRGEFVAVNGKNIKNPYYKSFSIKDSVRDTYAVSLVHTFQDEIAGIKDLPEVISLPLEEQDAKISEILANIFNRSDEESMRKIEEDLCELKSNAFGFETDSGKTDMVDQKIGANICWSGDATWAIWVAEDPSLEERDDGKEVEPLDLYFSIPTGKENDEATNIWFDALAMCENENSDEHQYEIAQAFIEFMCQPENAVQNCDAVGYTPGTVGKDVLNYMYWQFDVRGEIGGDIPLNEETGLEMVEGEDYIKYDLTYFYGDENTSEGKYEDPDAVLYAYPEYINRQLTAQFPLESDLVRLAMMSNFPEKDTANLLSMWERVRTNELPLWATIVFIVEGVAAISFVTYIVVKKVNRKKLKKQRS